MGVKKNKNDANNIRKNDSFLDKLKNDKKYKAKVEMIGYVIFILILIIYLNMAGAGSNGSIGNNINTLENNNLVNEKEESVTLLERLNNNYKYDINVSLMYDTDTLEDIEEVINYSGKSYLDNIEILKKYQDTTATYYKVKDFYYKKVNEEYKVIGDEEVYSFDLSNYIEVTDIKKYIEIASLDHTTDYSTGKKEYVYHLKLRDIIKNYTADDNLEISVVIENDVLNINVDYSKLISLVNEDVSLCKVEFKYTDIGKVPEFKVIEEEIATSSES